MNKERSIKAAARAAAANTGHRMGKFKTQSRSKDRFIAESLCLDCGCYVQVNTKPMPNEINIAGTIFGAVCAGVERIIALRAQIAAEEISIENGATPRYNENGDIVEDFATCGECGKSWNDALMSIYTPAPSGRCPYEYVHPEIAELARLEGYRS